MSVSANQADQQILMYTIYNLNYQYMQRRADQENFTKMHHQYYIKTKLIQKQDSQSLSKDIISRRSNNNLPLKKRCCITLTEKYPKIIKEEEILLRSLEQKEQHTKRSEEMNQNLQHVEKRKVDVIPGVIRQTSCPNIHLAFYFKYDE